jgi:hypothetical protein
MLLARISQRKGTKYLLVAAGFAFAFAAFSPPTTARADETDLPIVVNMSDLSSFVDSSDGAIDIVSDNSGATERDITGTETSGAPAVITVYADAPSSANPSDDDLVSLGSSEGGDSSYTGTGDGSDSTTDTSSFVPKIVTATTPTTITVAWVAPTAATTFGLSVNGESLPSQSSPNFTLTGLQAGTSYDLDMESSFSQSVTTPSAPTPPVSTSCPSPAADVTTTLSSEWDTSATGEWGSSYLEEGGLEVSSAGTSADSYASGYHSADLDLADVVSPSLAWVPDQSGNVSPSLEMVTDFDGDDTADGSLIQDGASNWIASSDSSSLVTAGAPHVGSGAEASGYGTLSEWQSAFPSAHLKSFGYSVGPDVSTTGRITSITMGCTEYSFESSEIPAAAPNVTDQSSYVSVKTPTQPPLTDSLRTLRRVLADDVPAESDHSTEVAYRTFIPYDYLSNSPYSIDQDVVDACMAYVMEVGDPSAVPLSLPSDYTFVGDNRTFQQPDSDPNVRNYRTSMDYRWDWDTSTAQRDQEVGATEVIRKSDDAVIATLHADKAGMQFKDVSHTADFATVTFDHVANDPFCPHLYHYGAITYKVKVSMYRSGLVTLFGDRFTMPSHEAWVRWNDEATWTNLFEANATNLGCLIGGAGSESVAVLSSCRSAVSAQATESTDTWATFNGDWGTTTSGRIWGDGPASELAADDGLGSGCYLPTGSIARGPILPSGVSADKLVVHGPWVTVLGSDHHIYTWGSASDIDIGRTATTSDRPVPTAVDDRDYKSFFVSSFQGSSDYGATYAVTTDGDVYAWGYLPYGPYDTSQPTESTPTLIGSGDDFTKVAAGDGTVIALDTSGNIYTYGESPYTDSNPDYFNDWVEDPVPDTTFTQIAVDDGDPDDAWALDSTGHLWYWNAETVENASTDGETKVPTPALVTTDATFTSINGNGSSFTAEDSTGVPYYVSSYDPPNFDIDDGANPYAVADAPPVTLTNYSTPSATGFFNGMGIDSEGNAWEYLPNSDYTVFTWVDVGLPPVRNPDPVCY